MLLQQKKENYLQIESEPYSGVIEHLLHRIAYRSNRLQTAQSSRKDHDCMQHSSCFWHLEPFLHSFQALKTSICLSLKAAYN